jgi:hypothetical protein
MVRYDELGHRVNALVADGRLSEACDVAEQCIQLLFREEAEAEIEFGLVPPTETDTVSRSHLRITANGTHRQIICSQEIVSRMFTDRLHAFIAISKLLSTDAMRSVSAGRLIFDIEDGSNLGEYPRVAFNSALEQATLVTDSYWYRDRGYEKLRGDIAANWINWEGRQEIIFWRGSTTGLRRTTPAPGQPITDWSWLQRLQLCDVARRSRWAPELDIGVSNFTQVPEPYLQEAIKSAGLMRPRQDKIDFLKYRYIVDIDGNACAWDGFYSALLMGACIFKVESRHGWREWYYDRLRPGEHYIPIKQNFSNFDEQVRWAFAHEADCAAIAASGKSVVDAMEYAKEVEASGAAMARQFKA